MGISNWSLIFEELYFIELIWIDSDIAAPRRSMPGLTAGQSALHPLIEPDGVLGSHGVPGAPAPCTSDLTTP